MVAGKAGVNAVLDTDSTPMPLVESASVKQSGVPALQATALSPTSTSLKTQAAEMALPVLELQVLASTELLYCRAAIW